MSLYDDLRKKLTPDMFTQVTDALGDDFDYDVVPRTRLNKVIKQRRELREQLDSVQQSGAKSNELDIDDDDDYGKSGSQKRQNNQSGKANQVDEAALRAQFEQEKNAAIEEMRVQYAALDYLRNLGAIDAELTLSQIDLSKVKLEDGKLTGIEEQANSVKENKSFLFTQEQGGRNNAQGGTGKSSGGAGSNGFEGVTTKADFLKLPTADQIAFKEANPELFKQFLNS